VDRADANESTLRLELELEVQLQCPTPWTARAEPRPYAVGLNRASPGRNRRRPRPPGASPRCSLLPCDPRCATTVGRRRRTPGSARRRREATPGRRAPCVASWTPGKQSRGGRDGGSQAPASRRLFRPGRRRHGWLRSFEACARTIPDVLRPRPPKVGASAIRLSRAASAARARARRSRPSRGHPARATQGLLPNGGLPSPTERRSGEGREARAGDGARKNAAPRSGHRGEMR
jgi:hypothetical protein